MFSGRKIMTPFSGLEARPFGKLVGYVGDVAGKWVSADRIGKAEKQKHFPLGA
jgi:hypothetical protein